MQKTSGLVFALCAALAISVGSVVFSCATDPSLSRGTAGELRVSTNTGLDSEGRIFTIESYSAVRSVVIIDAAARSRRTELAPGEWDYHRETTELVLRRALPYRKAIVHVEGTAERPRRFVLRGLPEGGDLFVIVAGRLAVRGFDYDLDGELLTFRGDLDMENDGYLIRYQTPDGTASLGNIDLGDADTIAYLEAEHDARFLREWYASRDEFYFLQAGPSPDAEPTLVLRRPTPEERRAMTETPTPVLKYRSGASSRKLSRELGFPVTLPPKVGDYTLFATTLQEVSARGTLSKSLFVLYRREDLDPQAPEAVIPLEVSRRDTSEPEGRDEGLKVSSSILDLGLSVTVDRVWGLKSSSLESPPTIALLDLYAWSGGGTRYSVTGDADREELYRDFVRNFIGRRTR